MESRNTTERIRENLQHLEQFTATPGKGCTRMPFTKETREAAEYLKEIMADAGLEVEEDCVGNLFGVLPGSDRALPCIMAGSHYDSVYNGGNYDGIAGVVSAIELARIFRDEGIQLAADYVVAAFMDEEGCRFGTGYFGSKCMLGQMTVEECRHYTDKNDISVYDAMKEYGLVPENLKNAAWPNQRIGHFIELHIEQGPVLDAKKLEIGLVECIVGIQRYMVTVNGRSDHAGTTPMNMRQDAVDIACKVISRIGDMAREKGDGTVATVGYMKAQPSAMNVVAASVDFSIDIRSTDNAIICELADNIWKLLDFETKLVGASYGVDTKLTITPVSLSGPMLDVMEASCLRHGYTYQKMASGAGHDSLAIGQTLDTVMIFVPSKDGRSHCPVEYTPYEDFSKAIQVLHDLIVQL
ncbi:M20 family metallo-hydrolase [Oscillospiraceae bacterium MB08-C2-2]|nr:M20 family metallo-hydrolase [Oscillospiraceae bacterium MB08-C2-2]